MAAERKKNKKSEIKRKKGKEIKERETDVKKEKNEARPKTVTSVSSHYEDFFPHRTESCGGPSVALKKVHKFKHLFATTNQQN